MRCWFVLGDVCKVLGLRTAKAKERLNSEDVNTLIINEGIGNPNKVCVNEPWFVLKDVCKVLEIGNPSQAKTRLNSEDVNKVPNKDPNRGRGNPN